jgi:hypothetical protein
MRHRPKRDNYPIGTFGNIDYHEALERYCTYLENKIKRLDEESKMNKANDTN